MLRIRFSVIHALLLLSDVHPDRDDLDSLAVKSEQGSTIESKHD